MNDMKREILYSENDIVDNNNNDNEIREENDADPCTPIEVDSIKVNGHLVTQVCTFS